jgi:hypothetical protein
MSDPELVKTVKAGFILLAAIQRRIADGCGADFRGDNAKDLKRAQEYFDQVYQNISGPTGGEEVPIA